MKAQFLVGGTGIVLEDGLTRAVRAVLDGAESRVTRGLLPTIERVADEGADKVPVRTGKLKRSIVSYARAYPDEVRVGIRVGGSAAPYAYYVKYKAKLAGLGRKSVFQTAIRKPALAAVDELAVQAGDALLSPVGRR